MTKIAVIFYSATGNVRAIAEAVAEGAADTGADVRLREVRDLSEEMLISQRQYWGRHRSVLPLLPEAELADLDWADGFAFGSPTRFGNVAAQLKIFLDQAGELWQNGRLANKSTRIVARSQGARLTQVARALAAARNDGELTQSALSSTLKRDIAAER
jgi:multimeric flavodoxin WrbA